MRRPRRPRPAYGSKTINSRGGSRKWSQWTAEFCRGKTCWLRFPKCTIAAESIDHFHPLKTHPHLADVRSNWRPACGYCNRARRHTPPHRIAELRAKLEAEYLAQFSQPKALGFFKKGKR